MFIENFIPDFKQYTKKVVSSTKSDIGQPITSYIDSTITGIIVNLRRPREISGNFVKQMSEYALYTTTSEQTKRGDLIIDGDSKYEVMTMRKIGDFEGDTPCHIHYLTLIQ